MKKFYIIVNPAGGKKKGLRILDQVRPQFEKHKAKINVLKTAYAGHARDYAKTIDYKGYDGICAVGGDGTMFELINGMLDREDKKTLPLGLITGGTGNAFMHDLDCLEPQRAVERILKCKQRFIDVAEIVTNNKKYYSFNIIAWGLANDAAKLAEKLRIFGRFRYDIASVVEVIRGKKRIARLSYGDTTIDGDFVFIIGCNTIHTGKGMKMAPKASIDDGKIDLIIVKKASKLKLLKLFPKIFTGDHIKSKLVDYVQVKEFSINTDYNSSLMIDGEIIGNSPCNVKIHTKKISVLV